MAIAEIYVTLKPALLDVQGATVLKSLHQLGHAQATDVRIGKYITVTLDDTLTPEAAQAHLDAMCRELLANPVIEDYRITLNGAVTGVPAAPAAVAVPTVEARDTVPGTRALLGEAAVPAAAVPAATAPTAIADPFSVAYADYTAMSADEQLELQGKAWQQHGAWIEGELAARGATWILAAGSKVEDSGSSLDTYPSDATIAALGASTNLIPWVFTRAPQD